MNKPIAQLFIMPFAGGAKVAFREFEKYIDNDIEVVTIEYPGRGTRIREPFCQTMEELVLDAKEQICHARNAKLPFAMMGYSMGCEVVFDLAQYALEEDADHLFFCARESIEFDTKGHDFALMSMEDFTEQIVAMGGIDDKIIHNERFLEIAIRPVYADYKLLHGYRYKKERGRLKQDITVFYSNMDTPKEKVLGWKNHTIGNSDFYELGKDHFFINECGKKMAEIVSSYKPGGGSKIFGD